MAEQKNAVNVMRKLRVEKIVLNCGCGTDHTRLEKSHKLLQIITNRTPVKVVTQKRIPGWGLRPGLPISTKVTLRGKVATEVLKRLVIANDNVLRPNNFDSAGNVAFSVRECIDIPGVEYDPTIGILGLQVTVTLQRPGFRIRRRKYMNRRIPHSSRISADEAMEFAKTEWGIKVQSEDQ
jgi:large subunit ribosomal protein L5